MRRFPTETLDTLIDTMRRQAPFVVEFKARDYRKRAVTSTYLMVMLALYVDPVTALAIFAIIQTLEHLRMRHMRGLPSDPEDVTRVQTLQLFGLDLMATTAYCLPSLPLVGSGTVVGLILGMMWLFSVSLHNIAGLALIQVWCWASLVPVAGINIAAVWLIYHGSYAPTGPWDALVVAISAAIYTGNMVEVTIRQRQNRRAFASARASADERLKKLEYLARHDAMTGLLNRRAFDEAVSDALLTRDGKARVALIAIDLDGFKSVNDTHGHAAGDAVLAAVAERMGEVFGDTACARLGGDEFAVLLPDCRDRDRCLSRSEELRSALHRPVPFKGRELAIGASVGVAFRQGPETVAALCARADRAMYDAKSNRLARVVMAAKTRETSGSANVA